VPQRRRALRLLVDADVDVEPPVLALLVDLALADEEARVEPTVRLCLGRQLDPGEDGAPVHRSILLDALAAHRDEELAAVRRRDPSA